MKTAMRAMAVSVGMMLAGCHGGSSASPSGAWPDKFKQGVLKGCTQTNPAPGVCDCVTEKLSQQVSFADFVAFTQAQQQGKPPAPEVMKKVQAVVAACPAKK